MQLELVQIKRSKPFMDWAVKSTHFPEYYDSRNGTLYKFHHSIKITNMFIFATSSDYKKAKYYLMNGCISDRNSWRLQSEVTSNINYIKNTSKGAKIALECRFDI